ncbi:class I SAM-dependent methyltransferase [Hyalangium rubrum]|uniref:Class I SAM-dependent methyltransferase n=1 Tax=Hyalangium rubrum TaxID=3103134 RepID=A0ABU5HJ82_9BACT|nr:class I SAM-dependent methyltransferase [Hyalangium sp. s54d21]MDY7232150.1 class I SAM-dependent methyltransferase [Hyalangium sp. s54d21]
MGITMSPQEYATAFRILAATARHPENIGQLVEERLLPRMPKQPALLDVGAGSGKVAERLAPYFGSLTLLEPNKDQIVGFKHEKAKVLVEPLDRYHASEKYELVVCSHVLYHVSPSDWGGFIDRLLSFVSPGGHCLIVMAAARGPTYELCRDFSETLVFSQQLIATVQQKRLPHEVIPTMSGFLTKTFEEMYTLCRFFVLEGCFTAEQLAALSKDAVRELEDKVRMHAEACRGADGMYRLEQDEDIVIIPKS